ncbi:hypothetical protein MSKU9_3224 [Komagataeibacter diospyri]|uniref:Uncharacterized protein n=1 Tax=Komagataeibacter diospyri TaxID=1932662 RepID=A0A4P5NTZ9_9PROT|nr:hypothetical protein MSKU9_3224 [Komagataeibacter diospyri]
MMKNKHHHLSHIALATSQRIHREDGSFADTSPDGVVTGPYGLHQTVAVISMNRVMPAGERMRRIFSNPAHRPATWSSRDDIMHGDCDRNRPPGPATAAIPAMQDLPDNNAVARCHGNRKVS